MQDGSTLDLRARPLDKLSPLSSSPILPILPPVCECECPREATSARAALPRLRCAELGCARSVVAREGSHESGAAVEVLARLPSSSTCCARRTSVGAHTLHGCGDGRGMFVGGADTPSRSRRRRLSTEWTELLALGAQWPALPVASPPPLAAGTLMDPTPTLVPQLTPLLSHCFLSPARLSASPRRLKGPGRCPPRESLPAWVRRDECAPKLA